MSHQVSFFLFERVECFVFFTGVLNSKEVIVAEARDDTAGDFSLQDFDTEEEIVYYKSYVDIGFIAFSEHLMWRV